MRASGAGGDHGEVVPDGTRLDRDHARGAVDEAVGDEGRRNRTRPLLLPGHLVLNEEALSTCTRAEDDAHLFAVRIGDLKAAVAECLHGCRNAPVDLGASAADLFCVEPLAGVEALHLASNNVRGIGGWIPVGDLRDAAAPLGEGTPYVAHGVADRRDDAEAGDNDASRVIRFAHASSYAPAAVAA